MVVMVFGGAVDGINGYEVRVEVDAGRGLPTFQIVGLPNTAVRESRERVMSAVRNCGLGWPKGRVTVNLAPAEVRKEGASLDLAVAVGVLGQGGCSGALADFRDVVFLGELSLAGGVEPVRGLLAIVMALSAGGRRRFVVPRRQLVEACLVEGIEVLGAETLREVGSWLDGESIPNWSAGGRPLPGLPPERGSGDAFLGLVDSHTRHLAMTAAAGRHNMLLVGTPGSGKTRLCRAVGVLQPEMTTRDAIDVLRISGTLGFHADLNCGLSRPPRPFRAPHHSVTRAGLVGGGAGMQPGEATLAHHGVLFLDELTEFAYGVLDALREPLEERRISVVRGGGSREWPADFQLLAAMNPCRCGWLGSRRRHCSCSAATVARHRDRLSGPFLDRIDLFCELDETLPDNRGPFDPGGQWNPVESRDRVVMARRILDADPVRGAGELLFARRHLDEGAREILDRARTGMALSIRSLIRCAGVARTVAALEGRTTALRCDAVRALGWRREAALTQSGAAL